MNRKHIITCLKAGLVPMMQGAPGAGKSAIFEDIANELQWDYLPVIMSVMEPIDPMGLPSIDVENHVAEFIAFGTFAQIYGATKDTLVLLDDLGQATASVQSAVMQIIHSRRLNKHTVPTCVHFAVATNRPKDRAGVQQVISPIRGRVQTFDVSTSCTCDARTTCDWHLWAEKANIHPAVSAFAKFQPTAMAEYDDPNIDHQKQICSARALEYLSMAEYAGIHDPAIELIQACIGEKYANHYLAFRTMYRSLPIYADIVHNPETAPVPNAIDQLIAISTMVTHQCNDADADNLMQYISRMPTEIATCTVMALTRKFPQIVNCKGFVNWTNVNGLLQ